MSPARRPTLRDVAREAEVSFKTVSRVVNGEGGVSDELVARVEAAVAQLDYQPDDRARRLRQGAAATGTIGFVLVDVGNPFFSSILRGIEEVARDRDCLVLAGSSDGRADRQRQLVDAFVTRRVDGLIVVPSDPRSAALVAEIERGTPVVFLDLEPAGDLTVDLVRSDHLGGAVRATEHLLASGHTDIAYFGDDPEIFSAGCRRDGFLTAMHSVDLEPGPNRIVTGTHTAERWRELVLAYLASEPRPSAIFTAQNFITLGAAQALHELGLRSTIAQVGFDDVELAEVVQPGLSVVPQSPWELGRRAALHLFDRIDGATHPPVRDIVANEVIPRGSGEIPLRF